MADNTKIEWTDATWNPVTGCSVVSPGCTNCYAMRLAGTRLQHHPSRAGLTVESKAGPVWNDEVRFNEQWLDQPLKWKRSRMIFVCAHGDLFHESVPDEWIDRVFAVMALAPQHTFQVLTKRADRMRAYLELAAGRIADAIIGMRRGRGDGGCIVPLPHVRPGAPWVPLPNVWPGVSAEDQKRADERIPDLLATPAAIRFVSAEPLLGAIDLTEIAIPRPDLRAAVILDGLRGTGGFDGPIGCLDWVIVGGESGPGARPMHPDWARSLRDQCAAAGLAFHFKQWGEFGPAFGTDLRPTGLPWSGVAQTAVARGEATVEQATRRLGKARAGRLLDGVEHNGMPEVRHG